MNTLSQHLPNEWMGYIRADGRVGVRNWLGIVGVDGLVMPLVQRLVTRLPFAVAICNPYGRGQVGADESTSLRTLQGLAANPNFGAVLVVGADGISSDSLAHRLLAQQPNVVTLSLQEVGEDTALATHRGIDRGMDLLRRMASQKREPAHLGQLMVGIECGHSDATSGLVANPTAGRLADVVVESGGTVLVGETYEWVGGEQALIDRAVNVQVAEDIVRSVEASVRRMQDSGRHWDNPGVENRQGGITTIEEKALGAIAKAGSGPILGVLAYGQEPPEPGLFLMDTPFFTPESLTAFAAAGAQITIMTTGVGNSFCNSVAPTVKVTANRETARKLVNQIDVDLSVALNEPSESDFALCALLHRTLAAASGELTCGELAGEGGIVISRFGMSV